MAAGIYDIIIEQGADWRLVMTWKDAEGAPVNLSGYTARMQVRETFASKSKLFELTTENGRITLAAADGVITLHLPAAVSAAAVINPAKLAWIDGKQAAQMVFDVEMIDAAGVVTRLIQGSVLFVPEVTK
ncbi:hypothetical protein [Microvirga alba]|uniref:Uncharacterized protein n=1 Tax=Microvirga alba TaxID=2791025 RepID=A0A931BQG0_9HYPH|nr:hypothetical protein [Microvirga alba]MBF9235576.1 hypothetical protein [Microvirga alba]